MQKLRSIQVLRGLAALGVVLCHALGFMPGAFGVDLFFVISGFIIGTVMQGREWREFAIDRLRRIYPIYWIALAPWLFVAWYGDMLSPARIAAAVTLWPVIGTYQLPYLPVSWTLCFEMLFYVAVTATLAFRCGRALLACFVILFVAALVTQSAVLAFVGNPLILEFLAGLALSRRPNLKAGPPVPIIALCVLVILLAPNARLAVLPFGVDGWPAVERVLWWGLPAFGIVCSALRLEEWARRPFVVPAVRLGDASYSLYLIHLLVMMVVGIGVIGAAASVGAALVMHQYIERPLMRFRMPNQLRGNAAVGTV